MRFAHFSMDAAKSQFRSSGAPMWAWALLLLKGCGTISLNMQLPTQPGRDRDRLFFHTIVKCRCCSMLYLLARDPIGYDPAAGRAEATSGQPDLKNFSHPRFSWHASALKNHHRSHFSTRFGENAAAGTGDKQNARWRRSLTQLDHENCRSLHLCVYGRRLPRTAYFHESSKFVDGTLDRAMIGFTITNGISSTVNEGWFSYRRHGKSVLKSPHLVCDPRDDVIRRR